MDDREGILSFAARKEPPGSVRKKKSISEEAETESPSKNRTRLKFEQQAERLEAGLQKTSMEREKEASRWLDKKERDIGFEVKTGRPPQNKK